MDKKMLSILNWIASTFVRNPIEDVVAAAIGTQPGKITLYLAMNRGCPEKADEDNGIEFLRVLRNALRSFPHDPVSAEIELIHMAVSATHARLSRKLEAIDNLPWTYTPHPSETVALPVNEQFDKMVMKWNRAGHSEGNRIISHARNFDNHASVEDGNSALRFLFASFISIIRTKKVDARDKMYVFRDVEDKIRLGTGLCGVASALVDSRKKFFGCRSSDDDYGEWRTIHRTSARMLVHTGLKFFATVLGNEGLKSFFERDGGFHIEWVGRQPGIVPDGHGRPYCWPKSPIDRFGELLAADKVDVKDRDKLLKDSAFKGPFGNVWKNQHLVTPYLHCELQLIHYLERNAIPIHQNMIGVSKLMCFACNAYVSAVNARRDHGGLEGWVLPGTSSKCHHAWLIPENTKGTQVVDMIREQLTKAIKDLATETLGRKRANSGGSDSSGGSRPAAATSDIPAMLDARWSYR
ncbi:hypothetical protein BU15DRAFT_71298 [Melanogaster broomeanus]|nr:hypothetical protein BU15DRAFT_71298 [Melanogaster broomeanus]